MATVLVLYCRRMGNQIAHSDWLATSTEAMTYEEEDVTTSSCFKKTLLLVRQQPLRVEEDIVVHWVPFLFLPTPSHTLAGLLPLLSRWLGFIQGYGWGE